MLLLLFEIKSVFQHQHFQLLGHKLNKYEYFYPSETQVGVNLNTTT